MKNPSTPRTKKWGKRASNYRDICVIYSSLFMALRMDKKIPKPYIEKLKEFWSEDFDKSIGYLEEAKKKNQIDINTILPMFQEVNL